MLNLIQQWKKVVIIPACLFSIAQAQLPADTLQLLQTALGETKAAAPGGRISITRYGKEIYSSNWGYADLEHNIPVTDSTIFEAGSVSKQFTATALLLLVAEGKIQLDQSVRTYLPDMPDYGTPLTVRQLLVHTAGVKDWGSVAEVGGWPRGTRTYTQAHTREIIFRQQTLNFPSGTAYSYSNSGYALAVALIEKVTGSPFASFTETRLFQPIGMLHTRWRSDFRTVVKNRALAYQPSGDHFLLDMPFEYTHGHGGLLTTTTDLQKWNQYWAEEGFGPRLAALRLERGILNNGDTLEYAAGAVMIALLNGVREISHSGATAGYRAWLAAYPEKGLSIAILSNDASSSVVPLGRKLAYIFLGKPQPSVASVKRTDNELHAYTGLFMSTEGYDLITVDAAAGKLLLNKRVEYTPLRDGTFGTGRLRLVFTDTNSVGVKTTNGIRYYRKQPPVNPSATALGQYTGVFSSEEADAVITIRQQGNQLLAYRGTTVSMPMSPACKDVFTTRNGLLLAFKRNNKGEVEDCLISIDRAENLVFKKIKKQ